MLSPTPKAEAPSSGPRVAFDASAEHSANSETCFAQTMDQVLDNPNAGAAESNPKGVTQEPAPSQGPAHQRSPMPGLSAFQLGEGTTSGVAELKSTSTGDKTVTSVDVSEQSTEELSSAGMESLYSLLLLSGITIPPPPPPPVITSPKGEALPEETLTMADAARAAKVLGDTVVVASTPTEIPQTKLPTNAQLISDFQPAPSTSPPNKAKTESAVNNRLPQEETLLNAPEEMVPQARPDPAAPTPPEAKNSSLPPESGIGTAKRYPQMKKTAENTKMSPTGDTVLPAAATLSSAAAVSATANPSRKEEFVLPATEAVNGVAQQVRGSYLPAEVSTAPAMETPSMVERVEQTIFNSAFELKRLGKDSMSVVLRPDSQTEMHLHLVVSNGRVDVEARISRGDLGHLQAHWNQLQQNLAQQGVRLQPIEHSQNFTQQGGGSFGGSSHFARQDSGESRRQSSLFEEELSAIPSTFSTRTTAARRLWESWA